jgi:hypothetical protein
MPPDILSVPDEWVRRTQMLSGVTRVAAVGAVATGASVATIFALSFLGPLRIVDVSSPPPPSATAFGVGVHFEALDTTVMPSGRGMRIEGRVEGEGFDISVTPDADGVCLHVAQEPGSSTACGALPGEGLGGDAFGLALSSDGATEVHVVAGVVAAGIPTVAIETRAGTTEAVLVDLVPAGFDAQLFLSFLPAGIEADAWVAMSDSAEVIERFDPNGPDPAGDPSPGADAGPDPVLASGSNAAAAEG